MLPPLCRWQQRYRIGECHWHVLDTTQNLILLFMILKSILVILLIKITINLASYIEHSRFRLNIQTNEIKIYKKSLKILFKTAPIIIA